MAALVLSPLLFREMFPEFVASSDALIDLQFGLATGFVSADTYGTMPAPVRANALYLMTAHLMGLRAQIVAGSTPGQIISSKVGDVQIQLQPPPDRGQWRYWLNLTPYGMQLAALLEAQAAGGFYVGGMPERAAFRRIGGVTG